MRRGAILTVLAALAAVPLPSLAAAPPPSAAALLHDAEALAEQGRYAEAVPVAEEALAGAEGRGDATLLARALHRLAGLRERMGRHEEAEALARRALDLRDTAAAGDGGQIADTLLLLGKSIRSLGRYDEAEPHLLRAQEIREAISGAAGRETGIAVRELAVLRYRQGRHEEAETLAQRALEIHRAGGEGSRAEAGSALNILGIVLMDSGRLEEAEAALRESVEIKREALGPSHPDVGASLNNLATALYHAGRFREAEPLYREAVALEEAAYGPEHPMVATDMANLAVLHAELGRYAEAEPLLRRSLAIREQALGPDHPMVADSLNNLAVHLRRTGRLEAAEAHYRRALEIWLAALGEEHPRIAVALNNLGLAVDHLGGDPRSYLERALPVGTEALGEGHPIVGFTHHHLGNHALKIGDLAGAGEHLPRALEIWEEALEPSHFLVSVGAAALAELRMQEGRLDEAEALFSRALTIRQTAFGGPHPDLGPLLARMAEVKIRDGDPGRARDLLARSTALLSAARDDVLPLLTREQQQAWLRRLEPGLHALLVLTASASGGDTDAVRLALDRWIDWKGSARAAEHRRLDAALGDGGGEAAAALASLRDAQRELARHWLRRPARGGEANYRERLAGLTARRDEAEARLVRVSATYSEEWRLAAVTSSDLASHLPEGSALLDFALVDPPGQTDGAPASSRYMVFTLRAGGKISLHDLGPAGVLNDAVAGFLETIAVGGAPSTLRRHARALHRVLLGPLEETLADADDLRISPDGALHLVPFEALEAPDGKVLAQRARVSYVPAGRDLVRWGPSTGPPGAALVLADADFDAGASGAAAASAGPGRVSSLLRGLPGGRFPRLPGTRQEGEAVAGLLGESMELKVDLRTGAAATEEALWSVSRPAVLHLATHGFFLEDAGPPVPPLQAPPSGLRPLLDPLPGAPGMVDPLSRAGIALAGANTSLSAGGDRGIVTAAKLLGMDLGGTELVVVSGCDTALGTIRRGQGVQGLERAFLLAGARSLILSLWPVSDEAARDLVTGFYRGWAAGLSKAEALRRARLDLKKRRPRAADWAAFILVGAPD